LCRTSGAVLCAAEFFGFDARHFDSFLRNDMTSALIALGSNLGDRRVNLDSALQRLAQRPDIRLLATSTWHESRPIGGPAGQPAFLNGAAMVETSLSPPALLAALREVEQSLRRHRTARWGPRTIDLDLLLFGQQVIDTPELAVPHPRMAFRRFVIEPAAEIAPDWRHPAIGWTLAELRDYLRAAPMYAAITGPPEADKTGLALEAARAVMGRVLIDPGQSPAGPNLAAEIELLRLREAQLARASWPSDGLPAISDYWFEQSLCLAEQSLAPEQLAEFQVRWRKAGERIVRPKLLVWLDPVPQPPAQRIADAQSDRLRQSLWSRATAPGVGPLLRLERVDISAATIELAAAIDAMRE